jgi:hypothetical protein
VPIHQLSNNEQGPAVAQAVSRWPLNAEARVRAQVSPCGICGGDGVTGTVFLCQYDYTVALHVGITWGMNTV